MDVAPILGRQAPAAKHGNPSQNSFPLVGTDARTVSETFQPACPSGQPPPPPTTCTDSSSARLDRSANQLELNWYRTYALVVVNEAPGHATAKQTFPALVSHCASADVFMQADEVAGDFFTGRKRVPIAAFTRKPSGHVVISGDHQPLNCSQQFATDHPQCPVSRPDGPTVTYELKISWRRVH
jgi:hypothetical protein